MAANGQGQPVMAGAGVFTIIVWIVVVIAILASIGVARSDDLQSWLLSWIPKHCCVTSSCCFEVQFSDLEPLADDQWRIRASGQILKRSGWSPDGRYWRCACDHDGSKWVVHPTAFTRCLFVPMQNS